MCAHLTGSTLTAASRWLKPKRPVQLGAASAGRPHRAVRSFAVVAAAGVQKLQFYDSGSCPYAHRVWLALEEKKVDYDYHKVDLANRSDDFKALYQSVSQDETSNGKVPILIDGDTTLIESNPIVEYLDWRFPSEGEKLLPDDPAQRYKVKLFADTWSEKAAYRPLLRASNKTELQKAKEKLVDGLKIMEKFLRVHGSDEAPGYFLGSAYSFAETSTSPFVRRMIVALPALRGVDVNAIAKQEGLTRLQQWIKASLDRASIKGTGASDEEIIERFRRSTAELVD